MEPKTAHDELAAFLPMVLEQHRAEWKRAGGDEISAQESASVEWPFHDLYRAISRACDALRGLREYADGVVAENDSLREQLRHYRGRERIRAAASEMDAQTTAPADVLEIARDMAQRLAEQHDARCGRGSNVC